MALFFSRRAYDTSKKKFTNNPSTVTRFLNFTKKTGAPDKGHIVTEDRWIELVKAEASSKDLVIFVHGFNTSQRDFLKRLDLIERGLAAKGFKGVVTGFDWPSDGELLGYVRDRNDAKAVAGDFVTDGIFRIQPRLPGYRIHIIAHSMGSYLVMRGFSGTGSQPGEPPWKINQLVFIASDLEADAMQSGAWGATTVELRTKRLTSYVNPRDSVLGFSESVYHPGRPRMGRVGIPEPLPSNGVDLDTEAFYLKHSKKKGGKAAHTWYFETDGFYRDLVLTISGKADSTMPTRQTKDGKRIMKP